MVRLTPLIVCSLVACGCGERSGFANLQDKLVAHTAVTDMPKKWKGYVRENTKPLGTGNFGEVWLARDNSTGQQVVVKFFFVKEYGAETVTFLNPSTAASLGKYAEENLQEARNECQAPKDILQETSFPQPNYVAECILDGVDDADRSYLVLELAGSKTLAEYMSDVHSRYYANNIHIAKRVRIYKIVAKMLLEALREFEGLYVHRDIKPANIMVSVGPNKELGINEEPWELKVVDWGLAVRQGFSGLLAGDVDFMPPETVRSTENVPWGLTNESFTFDATYDVYAVGEILFSYVCNYPRDTSVTWRRRTYNQMQTQATMLKSAIPRINRALQLGYDSDSNCMSFLHKDLEPLWELIKVMRRPASSSYQEPLRPLASKILTDFASLLEVAPTGNIGS